VSPPQTTPSAVTGIIGDARAYNGVHDTGAIDEVRVIADVLSPAWIAAEYQNATARASFISIGPEQQSR
jgi:hypothetical protein